MSVINVNLDDFTRRFSRFAGTGSGGQWLTPKRFQHALIAATWLMALGSAVLAARVFWNVAAPLPVPSSEAAPASAGVAETRVSAPVGLFGTPPVGAPQATTRERDIDAIADTSLNLELFGVWVEGELSGALIKTPSGEQKRFAIDDEVWRGSTLTAVYADLVILTVNGVEEALRLPNKAEISRSNAYKSSLSSERNRSGSEQAQESQPLSAAGDPRPRSQSSTGSNVASEPASFSFTNLSDVVSFRLARTAAGAPGIALYGGRDAAVFEQLGLITGDILLSVDGEPVVPSASSIGALRNQMSGRDRVPIVVEREGVATPITLKIK